MTEPYNILVTGVGGQGNLLCSRVLADAAIEEGLRPTIGETFGASRRGGTVHTHVRIGDEDFGPLIPQGRTDTIIGLEPLEALRAATKLGSTWTKALVSIEPVMTFGVLSGKMEYPRVDDILDVLHDICGRVYVIDPAENLEEIGTTRVLNSYMLGAFSGIVDGPFGRGVVRRSIEKIVRPIDINLGAFDLGLREFIGKYGKR